MKKTLAIAVFILAIAATVPKNAAQAQPNSRKSERLEDIKAAKIGFITRQLDLTQQEAEKFWVVYNRFENEKETIRRERRKAMAIARIEDFDKLSDRELEKIVDNQITFKEQELAIEKKYNAEFKKVLPIKKVARLYKAEKEFQEQVIKSMREKRDKK